MSLPSYYQLAKNERLIHPNAIRRARGLLRFVQTRPKNRSSSKSITVTLPDQTYNYLVYLAENGALGVSEADVASYLLIKEVDTLLTIGYHDIKPPKP